MKVKASSFLNFILQILTNVPSLKQTNVIPTLRVITLKDRTYAAALTDIRAMVKTAQVHPDFLLSALFTFGKEHHITKNLSPSLLAIIVGCSPSCGPNAFCEESASGGAPMCVCNSGFQGDGYNCTGWSICRSVIFHHLHLHLFFSVKSLQISHQLY